LVKLAEIERNIPLSAIAAICLASGKHHLPQPANWWSAQPRGRGKVHISQVPIPMLRGNRRGVGRFHPVNSDGVPPAVQEGNLRDSEYRYFIGVVEPARFWSKCRFCLHLYDSRLQREVHNKNTGCPKNLEAVYKLMLAKSPVMCALCERQTQCQRWGIPLCWQECQERWKFQNYLSHYFEKCKREALSKGLLSKPPEDEHFEEVYD
jgi:hypothetical protein